MKVNRFYAAFITSLIIVAGCVEPFDLPVTDEDVGFLVVNGYINTTSHTATVTLSRAIPLASAAEFPREQDAVVSVEEEGGGQYNLYPMANGMYELSHPNFTNGKRFRLRITTASKKDYYSAYITTKAAPLIDSLSWTATPDGVTIKLDTEDPAKKTKYYRWEFSETWMYNADFSSEYKIVNRVVFQRTPEEYIKTCYRTEPSKDIITNSTIHLTADKLVDQEIAFIPALSQKIRLHYSILVRQFALSEEAYAYWQQLEINTESLGGLFDPQPAQLHGNITRADDSGEPVIGYFDGGGVSEKRLFIRYHELPEYLQRILPNPECTEELIPVDSVDAMDDFHLLTSSVYFGFILVGYNYTTLDCADCRRQGGTTTKPSFWPN